MVHRPADSRLLSNLLQQEKDYLKHINQLLNSSAASHDSLTAYAAASPPPASQVILAVAGLLAAADDGLKRYAVGVEQWRDAMRLLKDMEDDVGNIMKDREILVTRLIKVSKSHKSNSGFRESLLLGSNRSFPSSSSLSLSVGNHDSPSPSPSRPISASFPTSTKLAAAQSELQACETHLASKESELALKRCAAVREGLSVRAKAMIDCSRAWGQLGREILRLLDDLGNADVRRNEHVREERPLVPEAGSNRPSSDFSSIRPSQSASQISRDGQQVKNTDSEMLGQPTSDNTVVPDPKRLSVSTSPTGPRPHSAESTDASSLYRTPATPTTYKLETVTYAPAIALVVPGRNTFSSSPPPPILHNTPLALGPSLVNSGPRLPTAPPVAQEYQGLHIKMHIPAAHAINEYDIPIAEAAGSGAGTPAWRYSRGESQEGSTQMDYTPQPQRTYLVTSASEPISGLGSDATLSNMSTSTSTLYQRHILERRITEEELQGPSTDDLNRGGGGQAALTSTAVRSALIEVFDDPESDNEEDDELPIEVEDQLIQQGKLAVFENPKFMSEQRKKELEKERERERMKAAHVEEGQEQESEFEPPVKERKRFSFLQQHSKQTQTGISTPTQGQSQSQSDTWHATVPVIITSSAPSTTRISPSKAGGNSTDTSPSKRFLGSLRGLFGMSPQVLSQAQDSSSPSRFGFRKQNLSPSQSRARSPSGIRSADNDSEDSDLDSPSKLGGGLQALFRGAGVKKKVVPVGGTRWSTRTDRNVRKLTRDSALGDDIDGYLPQVAVGNGIGIAGNAALKAGPDSGVNAGPSGTRRRSASHVGIGVSQPVVVGGISAGPSGTRKRSASHIGIGAPPPAVVSSPKVPTRGGKRLKKTPAPVAANAGPVPPTSGPVPVIASTPAATANPTGTTSPSRPTPNRKASIGKTQTPNAPVNIKTGSFPQPHAQSQPQPQPHHQPPTSHLPSSSGGAIVLAAGGTHPSGTLISHPGWDAQALPTPGGGLSRNNSILSVTSAPSGGSMGGSMSKTKKQKQTILGHGMGSGTSLGRRSSLGSSSGPVGTGGGLGGKGEKNIAPGRSPTGSVVQPTQPAPSLMSIIEDVAKHNREWSQKSSRLLKNKNKSTGGLDKEKIGPVVMMDVVKAPPRVGRDELVQLNPATIKSRVTETTATNLVPGAVTSASGGSGSGARLVDIKAPGSALDQRNVNVVLAPALQQRMQQQASNSAPDLTQRQQAHHSNLTRRASATIPTATSKRPAKSPLRSALKNPSRTPSPFLGSALVPHLQKQEQYQQRALQEGSRHPAKSIVAPVPVSPTLFSNILGPSISPEVQSTRATVKAASAMADTRPTMGNGRVASVSASVSEDVAREYIGDSASTDDTENEVFYTDDEGQQSEAVVVSSTDNRAVNGASPMLNEHAVEYTSLNQATGIVGGCSELSNSTFSTAVGHHPVPATISSASQPTIPRRKSVRVSLQPTFSPSPPAIEYEEEQKYHAPWAWKQDHRITEGGSGGGQHVHAPVPLTPPSPLLNLGHRQKVVVPEQSARAYDIWEDSSDEDVEYQKAKRLLTRAARKEKNMNAFAAGSRS